MVHPQPGNLRSVEAGFETGIGAFGAEWRNESVDGKASYHFQTPVGTTGSLVLDVPTGFHASMGGQLLRSNDSKARVDGLAGRKCSASISCSNVSTAIVSGVPVQCTVAARLRDSTRSHG